MKKKKNDKPPLVPCKKCQQSGKCARCGGTGVIEKYNPRILLDDQILSIACTDCGDGEIVGEAGYVYPSHVKKIGNKKCAECNGVGWVVERVDLKYAP